MAYIGTQPKDVRSFGKAKFDYTSTQGQTAFTGADDDNKTLGFTDGQIEVFVNGILMDESDFTTSNGNTVTLASAANLNDVISIVAMQTDIPNSDYVPASGGTFTAGVTVQGTVAATAYTGDGSGLTGTGSPSIVDNGNATAITIDSKEHVGFGGAVPNANISAATFPASLSVGTQGVILGNSDSIQIGSNYYWDGSAYKYLGSGKATRNYHTAGNVVWEIEETSGSANGAISFSEKARINEHGLCFNGDTAAANALDDYEEGTFNLTLVGYYSSPSTTQTIAGYYTKIGNTVHIFCRQGAINNTGASGHMWCTGLPFASNTPYTVLSCTMDNMGTYPNSSPMAYLAGSIAYIDKHVNQAARSAVFHNVTTAGVITITGSYRI